MKKIWTGVLGLFAVSGVWGEDLGKLLETYRIESDLSKITVKETAGVVDVFTRDMLERMQAHTLSDVLKNVAVLNYSRTARNVTLFTKSSVGFFPVSSVRLYINDHDMTSASFGSALLIWGDMPVEQIDHIEVYKGASSNEFGNETGSIIIRLYTKTPERDEGGKARLMVDDAGSYEGHLYYAHTAESGWKTFFYGEKDYIQRETFEYHGCDVRSDKHGNLLQATLSRGDFRVEMGRYAKKNDEFLGESPPYRPDGGGLDAKHAYIHMSYRLPQQTKLTIAFDDLDYHRQSEKALDSLTLPFPVTEDFSSKFRDKIYTVQLEKSLDVGRWHFFSGIFYKYKSFESETNLLQFGSDYPVKDSYEGGLNLYSFYVEGKYALTPSSALAASLKIDRSDYSGGVNDYTRSILRAGYLYKDGTWSLKFFVTRGYLSVPMYQLYGGEENFIGANPDLEPIDVRFLGTADLGWRKGGHEVDLQVAYSDTDNQVVYRASQGFVNMDGNNRYRRAILRYTYHWNPADFTRISWYGGAKSPAVHLSPDYGVLLESFNSFGDIDLYQALHMRGPYTLGDTHFDASWDYTVAVKYHLTSDLSIGLRGENLLNDGFVQGYQDLDGVVGFPVYDQKIWLNVEYLF
ncbi:MAG: TonB-dependent receptor plug domain-containing protein [Epsilonproteobacteria bacterium]|nr:TonB-dependent receptor plug domain-containing protein [Campylobacterota bacterium]